jgi:RND family efflux transporter MFP subunit
MKKTILVIVGVGLAGWGGWSAFKTFTAQEHTAQRSRRRPPVAVEIEPIQKKAIVDAGRFSGSLVPLSEIRMAPKISGRLEQMQVDIGDRLTPNQLLAVLDREEYNQQVIQAKAELAVARANLLERRNTLENARREHERTVTLRHKKIVSESQLDAAQSELKNQEAKLKVALAQVSQKEALLKTAEIRLSYTEVRVPPKETAGYLVVGERFVDEGAIVNSTTPLLSVLEIGRLTAVIHVIERDYPKLKIGLAARLTTDAYPGRTFGGKVARIAPMIREKSREARVEIEVPNPHIRLKPGMFVRVAIEFETREAATLVPITALVKRENLQGVFLADRDAKKAHFVPVTLGIVNDRHAEVVRPPLTGHVVTLGQHLLEEGAQITLPGASAGPPGGPKPKRGEGKEERAASGRES